MTILENINFNIDTTPDDEMIEHLRQVTAETTIHNAEILRALDSRFRFIIEKRGRCEMSANDDKLIALAIKISNQDSAVWGNAFFAAEYKIRPYVTKIIKEMKVEAQDWEDCYSEVRSVMFTRLPNYDSDIATLITYLQPHIRHALYGNRNQNSRYTSTIIKLSLKAKDALVEMGKTPTSVAISEYINTVTPLSREVSSKQVENALEYNKYAVDLNENATATSEVKNPETSYLEKEYAEELRKACDAENWAVKTMFDIFKEYYLSDNPESFHFEDSGKCVDGYRKKLPESYLRSEMKKRTGVEFSDEKINSIIITMGEAMQKQGYGHSSKNNNIFIRKKKVDDVTVSPEELDVLLADIMASAK